MKRFAISVLLLSLLGACALTTDEVNLQYNSMTPQNPIEGESGVIVQVSATEGRAANLDKVSVKKNGYGMEMASIISKQSLPDLLKAAVQQELRAKGFQIGPGPVLVNVELARFYNDFKSGFFSGNAVAEVALIAQVKGTDGHILYTRNITGDANEGGVVIASGDNAKLALDKALSTCVARLMSDPTFTQAIVAASRGGRARVSWDHAGTAYRTMTRERMAAT